MDQVGGGVAAVTSASFPLCPCLFDRYSKVPCNYTFRIHLHAKWSPGPSDRNRKKKEKSFRFWTNFSLSSLLIISVLLGSTSCWWSNASWKKTTRNKQRKINKKWIKAGKRGLNTFTWEPKHSPVIQIKSLFKRVGKIFETAHLHRTLIVSTYYRVLIFFFNHSVSQ